MQFQLPISELIIDLKVTVVLDNRFRLVELKLIAKIIWAKPVSYTYSQCI